MKIKSTFRILIAGTALTVLLAGCGAKDKPSAQQPQLNPPVANADTPAKPGSSAPADQPQQPQAKTAAIQTFYGNENGTSLVVKQTTITYAADSDKYVAALNALRKSPDNKAVALFDGFTFKKAALEQDKLKLDVKLADDGRLGSGGEELVLQALQKALFQFPEVNEIYVTVDGKQVDSLMGHVDLPYPIKRK